MGPLDLQQVDDDGHLLAEVGYVGVQLQGLVVSERLRNLVTCIPTHLPDLIKGIIRLQNDQKFLNSSLLFLLISIL